jgi:hypothetical protein
MKAGHIVWTTRRGGFVRPVDERDLISFSWKDCVIPMNECGHGCPVTYYEVIERGRRIAFAVTRRTTDSKQAAGRFDFNVST